MFILQRAQQTNPHFIKKYKERIKKNPQIYRTDILLFVCEIRV